MAKIRQRFDTLENWTLANPILAKGELAVVVFSNDDKKVKIGDGVTAFTSLGYVDDTKQDILVSGTSIKTINGVSILGEGDIEIEIPEDLVQSVNGKTGEVVIGIADIADLQNTLDSKSATGHTHTTADITDLLDGNGKFNTSFIPSLAITDVFTVADETAMLALDVQKGDIAIRSDESKTYVLAAEPASVLANWILLQSPADAVTSVNGKTGVVALVIADIPGLQDALDSKAEVVHSHDDLYYTEAEVDTFLGTKQDTLVSGTNIKTVNGISVLGEGDIEIEVPVTSVAGRTGDVTLGISDIVDLQNTLDGKAAAVHAHDDLYYTESEMDTLLSGKSDVGHEHTTADITDLLDGSGKINTSFIPSLAITDIFTVANEAAMLALEVQAGDIAIRTDIEQTFIFAGGDPTELTNWVMLLTPSYPVLSVNGKTGVVVIDIVDIAGLQDELDSKQDTLVSGTNIKTVNGESVLGSGDIEIEVPVTSVNGKTGDVVVDIADIADLQDELDSKQETLVSGVNIKTVNGESILGEGNLTLNTGSRVIGSIANINDYITLDVPQSNIKFRLTKIDSDSAELEVSSSDGNSNTVYLMKTSLHDVVGVANWTQGDGIALTSSYLSLDDNIYMNTDDYTQVHWVNSNDDEWELTVRIGASGGKAIMTARLLSETQTITSSVLVNSTVVTPVFKGSKETIVTINDASGTVDLDLGLGNIFVINRTGNITGFTISNFQEGVAQLVQLKLNGSVYTVDWGSIIKFPSDETPTLSETGYDTVTINFFSSTEGAASRILNYA